MSPDAEPRHADVQLEEVIIGQIAMGAGAFESYTGAGLEPKHFSRHHLRLALEAAAGLADGGQPVEIIGLHRELVRRGRADDFAGKPFAQLAALTDGTPWPRNLDDRRAYVRANTQRLHELWALRATREGLEHVAREMRGVEPDRDALAADLTAMQERLARPVFADDGDPDAAYRETMMTRDQTAGGALLGLDAIDDAFTGIAAGQVCVIEARGGVGKTIALTAATRATHGAGWGVVFVSLEMTKADIFERLYRGVTGLDRYTYQDALRADTIDRNAWLRAYPRLVLHDGAHSLQDIERLVLRAQQDQLIEAPGVLLVIDYLGLVRGNDRLSAYERVSAQARELKELAKRRRVAVLVAVQVSREAGADGSKQLTLGAARDSGAIEEAADKIIGFRRLDQSPLIREDVRRQYNATLFASILKHRAGDTLDGREIAYRIDWRGFRLNEDTNLHPPEAHDGASALGRNGRR